MQLACSVALLDRGFHVKVQRRTYDQSANLGTIRKIAMERDLVPSLGLISDIDYNVGMARIEEELAARGADALWPSHLCVVEAEATRGTLTGKKRWHDVRVYLSNWLGAPICFPVPIG